MLKSRYEKEREKKMKRDLFVFSGQSNMMGASVFPPKTEISFVRSFEYKHKARRLGARRGEFSAAVYPVGEFSYKDMDAAYAASLLDATGKSRLENYIENTYFCPAMSNLKSEKEKSVHVFAEFSEATAKSGVSLAPFLVWQWEQCGKACAYAHIAKGCVSIDYYMTEEMAEEYAKRIRAYNRENGCTYDTELSKTYCIAGAAEYFFEKSRDFFKDAEARFGKELSGNKCFFWLQGESDAGCSAVEYEIKMDILWEGLKAIGFSHFFCIRIDYFGADGIYKVMAAQENFVSRHKDAYMLTRAASYLAYPGQNEEEWFIEPPSEEYRLCRDSFYGYPNDHINEKGFSVIAEHAVKNLCRVLSENKEPLLEKENIRFLTKE